MPGPWHQGSLVFWWVMSLQIVNALLNALVLSEGEVATVDEWGEYLPPLYPVCLSIGKRKCASLKKNKTKCCSGFVPYFTYMLLKTGYAKTLNQLWIIAVLESLIMLFFTDLCLCDRNFDVVWGPPGCAKFCTDYLCNTGLTKETRVLPYLSTFLSVKHYQRSNITWFRISSGHCNPRLKLISW